MIQDKKTAMKFLALLEKQNKLLMFVIGGAFIGTIGYLDFLTGHELSLSVFYVLPIFLITWFTNRQSGLFASLTSAAAWLGADFGTQYPYSNPLIPVWNSFIRFAFFIIITLLLSTLKNVMQRETELARIDYLTGAINIRYFYELTGMEIDLNF